MPERDTSGKVEQSFQMMRDTFRPVFCRYNFLDAEVSHLAVFLCASVCLCVAACPFEIK